MATPPVNNPTNVAKPNAAILDQLKQIVKIDALKKQFVVLPKDQTHKTETQWSKAYVLGAAVLVALTGYAYKLAYKYAAAAFAVGALYALTKTRVTVDVPNAEYTKQCEAIRAIFKGVAPELRKVHDVMTSMLCTVLKNDATLTTADQVAKALPEHVNIFISGAGRFTTDPFSKAPPEELEWRAAAQAMNKDAGKIASFNLPALMKDADLHEEIKKGLTKVHPEAVRLIFGDNGTPGRSFLEVKTAGEGTSATVVIQPWSAPALKA